METLELTKRVIIDPKNLLVITKIKHCETSRIVVRNGFYGNGVVIEIEEYLKNPKWEIHEVLTHTKFVIGAYTNYGEIKSFQFSDDGNVMAVIKNRVDGKFPETLVNVFYLSESKLLFRSEDGFDIFPCDQFYVIWYPLTPPESIIPWDSPSSLPAEPYDFYSSCRRNKIKNMEVFYFTMGTESTDIPKYIKDITDDVYDKKAKVFYHHTNSVRYFTENYKSMSYLDISNWTTEHNEDGVIKMVDLLEWSKSQYLKSKSK